MGSRRAAGGKALKPGTVHQEDIEPAIVVVIVKSDAASGGFEEIFIFVFAAEDGFRIQTRFTANVQEADAKVGTLCLFRWRRIGLLLRLCSRSQPVGTGQREHVLEREHESRAAERC